MSRIGKQPIAIPQGVTVDLLEEGVQVKGPKGSILISIHPHVRVAVNGSVMTVTVLDPEEKGDRSLWGLMNRLLANGVIGVTKGFEKKLELNGVGYKVALSQKGLTLSLGFSHPVEFILPEGITAVVEKNTVTLSGIDKQQVGEIAARVRSLRKPEPYKGKGIKYADEVIRRKAGKAAKAGAK
ncbi:MAG: 50S ribosomal protein L6 [Patescibacteria group bacterium]